MSTIKLLPRNEHWYMSTKHKGVYYPSVTYVNQMPKGAHFDKYLADQESYEESQRILREAGERGTRVHQASELLEKGQSISYNDAHGLTDEEYKLLEGFVKWHNETKPECAHIELKLISDKLRLGGTADRVYIIDGKRVLFDLKTSKSAIYPYHFTQCGAYAQMYEDLHKLAIDQTAILRLTPRRKEGYEYVVRDRETWKNDYKQFLKNYDTFKYLNLKKGKKVLEPSIVEIEEVLTLESVKQIQD